MGVVTMNRRLFLQRALVLTGLGLMPGCGTLPGAAPRVSRIGFISPGGKVAGEFEDNCKLGLADLGYVEGQHYTVESRYAQGDADRLPALADELVGLAPDVIVAGGTQAIVAARTASSTVPIVMTNRGDPVGGHVVTSLARPGGNITGVSGMAVELSGKRLELFKEFLPGATRLAAIWNAPDESMGAEYGATRVAG